MLFEAQTPVLVASNMLLLVIIYYSLQPAYYNREENPPIRLYWGLFCIFLFCMFSFWGRDWFGYQSEYQIIKQSVWYRDKTSLEPFYVWLITISPHYLFFRFVIFGTALTFVFLIISHLEVNRDLAWFFFGVLFLPLFGYARVSLPVVMMIYGSTLITKPWKNRYRLSWIVGVSLILGALFFHKSAALGIVVVLFSLISRTTNRNSWFYIILAFIIVAILARILVSYFLSGALDTDDVMAQKSLTSGQHYMNKVQVDRGPGALLNVFLERVPYYMIAYLSYLLQSEYKLPKGIEGILKIEMYLILFSSVFAVDLGANTSTLYGRLLRFSLIPSTIILTYAYHYDLYPKLVKLIFFISLVGTINRVTYTFYNRLVG